MRVVLISSGVLPCPTIGYGGLEQIVADLAIVLDRMGHEVWVVAPDESTIGEHGNIQLIGCGPCDNNAHAWEETAFQKYRPMMESEEFKDAIWHTHDWRKWAYRAKFDLPHVHVMGTLHGMLCYEKPPPFQHPNLNGISRNHADGLSAGLGVPVRCVYNGIDLDKYKYGSKKGRTDRLLFLARITSFKGAHVFPDLCKQLKASGDLVGDDTIVESQELVERVIMQCNDYPDCRYWGGVSRERTIEFFQSCKTYVLPLTPGWLEPFGLTIVEAGACGAPVVATDSGSMPELIEDGVNGYVAKNLTHMKEILENGCLDSISSQDCRKMAKRFSRETMAEGYVALYQEILETGGW